MTEAGCTYRALFLDALADADARPNTVLEFGSVEAIKQCVLAGMGITMFPAFAVQSEITERRLAALPWPGTGPTMVTQMVWNQERWESPALRAFLALTREVLAPPGRELSIEHEATMGPRR